VVEAWGVWVACDGVAGSALMLSGLALSRASSLPQGVCVAGGVLDWPRGFRGFFVFGSGGMAFGLQRKDQRICSVELPTVLVLLLACNACYTSVIDRPSGH